MTSFLTHGVYLSVFGAAMFECLTTVVYCIVVPVQSAARSDSETHQFGSSRAPEGKFNRFILSQT